MATKGNDRKKKSGELSRKERLERGLPKTGEIAELAGVALSLVRYYTDIGLLRVAGYPRVATGYMVGRRL